MLVLVLALAVTPTASAERPVRSLLEYRREGVIIQQWDVSCGAAALATVLTYGHDYPIEEETVAKGMLRQSDPLKVKFRGGFSLLDMKRFAKTVGFESAGYSDMSLEDLPALLPAIVPLKVRGFDHFVVIHQVKDGKVLIADPGWGKYALSEERFLRAWQSRIAFHVEPK
jgi:predicted double-glycine peptidase